MGDRPMLEETIALLEATLDATHDAILVVDLDGRIIRFNRQLPEHVRLHRRRARARRYATGGVAVSRAAGAAGRSARAAARSPESSGGRAARRAALQGRPGLRALHRAAPDRRAASSAASRAFATSAPRYGPPKRSSSTGVSREGAGSRAHRQLGCRARRIGSARLVRRDSPHLRRAARRRSTAPSTAFFAFVHPDDRAAVRAPPAPRRSPSSGAYDIEHRIVRARRHRALGPRARATSCATRRAVRCG